MTKTRIALVVGLIFGILCLWGAVGSWLGVARAVGGPRTPGTVVDVRCAYVGGTSCSGTFTSTDGSIRGRRMHVEGPSHDSAGPLDATYVPRIANGLDGAIQSDDTAYVGSVTFSLVVPILIAVALSALGLLFTLPYVVIGLLMLNRRALRA